MRGGVIDIICALRPKNSGKNTANNDQGFIVHGEKLFLLGTRITHICSWGKAWYMRHSLYRFVQPTWVGSASSGRKHLHDSSLAGGHITRSDHRRTRPNSIWSYGMMNSVSLCRHVCVNEPVSLFCVSKTLQSQKPGRLWIVCLTLASEIQIPLNVCPPSVLYSEIYIVLQWNPA